ncbi:MAG: thioesterase [Thermodesulfobacteriota bacterium]|nr:MAG: thioesterase [Thermodesulfobacteriota bacterium]
MIREIENIFLDFPDYGCFACDPRNKLGLRLKFFADDEKEDVFTTFHPETHLEGFPGILHGGIQCALIDEVAFWTMFDKYKKIALTSKLDMEFLRPVDASSELTIRGKVTQAEGRKVSVEVSLLNNKNKVCTRSKVDYTITTREVTYKLIGKERFTEKFQKYLED